LPPVLDGFLKGFDVAQAVANSLAPAILVSAAGLFLLGLQNKFHNVADRIRQLDKEILDLEQLPGLSDIQSIRLSAVETQVDLLITRCRLVRDAIFFLFVAVFIMIASSLVTAFGMMLHQELGWIAFALFVAGVISMSLAMVQSIREVLISFKVIEEEVDAARYISPLRKSKKESTL
jgi:hypothetical protein